MGRLAISDCTHFGFLLLPSFTLLSFSSAVEVLRMANHLSGKPIYRWSILHPTQSSIVSSNGIAIGTQPLNGLDMPDMLFVCGGTGLKEVCGNEIISTLRDLAARGEIGRASGKDRVGKNV